MTSEGLGEMLDGDSADTCGGKFPLVNYIFKLSKTILNNFPHRGRGGLTSV